VSFLELQDNARLLTSAQEGSTPATYEQFSHQFQHIRDANKRGSDSGARIISSSDSIRFEVGGESGDHFYISVSTPSIEDSLCDFLFFPTSGKVDYLRCLGRSVFEVKGPSTAAMPDIWRHWLHSCSESHALCRALGGKQTFLPDRLIEIVVDEDDNDILSWRLSCRRDLNPVSVRYLTLSHCWGLSGRVKLTKRNYYSFLIATRDSSLPKTYRDAFRVTVSLGFRLLWIDSLCIIQDDLDDWRTQSLKMGEIYSNADCNIAATWASDGGDGCFNKRDPFTVTPTTIMLNLENGQSREFQFSGHYTYNEDITDAPLNTRGWVVQERYLARKQLSFAKNKVYWECPEVIASEQFPMGLPEYVRTAAGYMKLESPAAKPGLQFRDEQKLRQTWCSLVETYSDCHLTQPSDKMIALAGLAGRFRDMTGDTYLAGLWKADLFKQLCWKYQLDVFCSDDRERNLSRTLSYHAPTWSWASFDGPVQTGSRYSRGGHGYVYFSEILDVSVNSEDPSKLHSFVSSELQIRGIMIWARAVTIDNDDVVYAGTRYEVLLTPQSNNVGASSLNRSKFYVFWDENVRSSDYDMDPQRWHRLQEERSSELLLMFIIGSWDRKEVELESELFDGLVLREQLLPDGKNVFVRLRKFEYGIEFLDMLATKLNLQPDDDLVGRINLDDPRLADLVHTVTII
jgi:hypothetical protein